jgi:hypothetical protein
MVFDTGADQLLAREGGPVHKVCEVYHKE